MPVRTISWPRPICSPPPFSRPRPPILVGGSGERKTLRLVARYADACNLFAPDPDVVAQKLEVLARHCDAESRDPDSIRKTILGFADPFADTAAFLGTWTIRQARRRPGRVHAPAPDPAAWVSRLGEEDRAAAGRVGLAEVHSSGWPVNVGPRNRSRKPVPPLRRSLMQAVARRRPVVLIITLVVMAGAVTGVAVVASPGRAPAQVAHHSVKAHPSRRRSIRRLRHRFVCGLSTDQGGS